ncbi:MAG: folate hydrolase [Acidobacteria bacterium]|nr:MAG: folate hydrolase [Acidobacteriota bacterium]
MRSSFVTLTALILVAWTLLAQQDARPGLAGFSGDNSRAEQEWEQRFRSAISPDNIGDYAKLLSARPHHVGSAYDKHDEEWLASKFKEWGWDVHVESFQILFPTPKERVLEMVEPVRFVAKLQEPPIPEDPSSNQQAEQLPSYNAYSIDGDVTAPLVYVNYGIPDDYEELERMGVSVKGAIVIARYGASWRGIKPKVAFEHGAVGCLIYSDPRDDGYTAGDVYPKGPWRPAEGVQRGSVVDMALYPGDPLTPGVGATSDAKRLKLEDVKVFTKIPVQPVSYADAQPLLAALAGPVAPARWRGGLPITYHVGPGPAKVHLKLKFNWDMKQINDVIARIPGASEADEWVIRGNHFDAWVNGAQDPVSGISAEMEEARTLGELSKAGWKPKRTIIYCAWDAEEPGLIGSTEWVETHADELRAHAVAYINTDSHSRGYLNVEGSHSLETFINQVAREVTDPEKNISVWQRRQLRRIADANSGEERERLRSRTTWPIQALGSGSDYTAFLDFAGVASLDLNYSGETDGGVYHSVYDDFYWFTHFSDVGFVYGRALAQTAGTAVLRLADADLLPFNFTDLFSTVRDYVNELQRLAENQSDQIRERNRQISEGVFSATSDPQKPLVAPAMEAVPPHLNFASLQNALDALNHSADHYERVYIKAAQDGGATLGRASLAQVNLELLQSERALTDANGLLWRPWFKHQLYAPGFYTGYGVKTVPAVREAIEQKQWSTAEQSINTVSKVLENEAAVIEKAAISLEQAIR